MDDPYQSPKTSLDVNDPPIPGETNAVVHPQWISQMHDEIIDDIKRYGMLGLVFYIIFSFIYPIVVNFALEAIIGKDLGYSYATINMASRVGSFLLANVGFAIWMGHVGGKIGVSRIFGFFWGYFLGMVGILLFYFVLMFKRQNS